MDNLDQRILALSTQESHFFHLYKNESKLNSFKERMRNDINQIKQKQRKNNFDLNRALDMPDEEEESKLNDNCFYRQSTRVVGKSKKKWANLMMLAEWFMMMPDSFYGNNSEGAESKEQQYLMKLCPFGKHAILISQHNTTQLYNKNGFMIDKFKSSLPAGGLSGDSSKEGCAIFDCIYSKDSGRIYLLDIIYFMRQDFRVMAAEDRFNWLENYLRNQMIDGIQSSDHYSVEILSAVICQQDTLRTTFSNKPPFPLDGLLFYLSDGTYVSGSTYLSMWLKPYMVPELLSLEVHPDYMTNIPMDYANYRDEIIRYNAQFGWHETQQKSIDVDKQMDVIE